MRGVILEGVIGSGKTTIARLLRDRLVRDFPACSQLYLSEHYTERMVEHHKHEGRIPLSAVSRHLATLLSQLSQFQAMLADSRFATNPGDAELFVLLERGALTFLSNADVTDYDLPGARAHLAALQLLKIKQVVLTVPEARLRTNIFSTVLYRSECWRSYLSTFGTESAAAAYFWEWQRRCMGYAAATKDVIETRLVEIADESYDHYAREIYDWAFPLPGPSAR